MRCIATILALGAVTLGPATLPAQNPAAQKLAEAKVLEEGEHDFAAATTLYRTVAEDDAADAATRTEAWLRLGVLLQRHGDADGAKQALEAAAKGKGAAAEAAQKRLQAPQDASDSGSVELEILKQMSAMRTTADSQSAVNARYQLVWFGERAVPLLIKAANTESDYTFVTDCARALFAIGGPTVEAWIAKVAKDDDALRRRAVVRAASIGNRQVKAESLVGFLSDSDPEVRLEAIQQSLMETWNQVLVLVQDDDARVRRMTWGSIGRANPDLAITGDAPARILSDVAERAAASIDEVSDPVGVASALLFAGLRLPSPVDRARVALTILRLPQIAARPQPVVAESHRRHHRGPELRRRPRVPCVCLREVGPKRPRGRPGGHRAGRRQGPRAVEGRRAARVVPVRVRWSDRNMEPRGGRRRTRARRARLRAERRMEGDPDWRPVDSPVRGARSHRDAPRGRMELPRGRVARITRRRAARDRVRATAGLVRAPGGSIFRPNVPWKRRFRSRPNASVDSERRPA